VTWFLIVLVLVAVVVVLGAILVDGERLRRRS
jgi:hypothetical protein